MHSSHPSLVRGAAVAALLLALAGSAAAQSGQRPLTHADYAPWKSIQAVALSPDGKYLAYALVPQEGDGEFVVRNLATGKEWRHPRGSGPLAGGAGRFRPGTPPAAATLAPR